jgi:hypothetical protein
MIIARPAPCPAFHRAGVDALKIVAATTRREKAKDVRFLRAVLD